MSVKATCIKCGNPYDNANSFSLCDSCYYGEGGPSQYPGKDSEWKGFNECNNCKKIRAIKDWYRVNHSAEIPMESILGWKSYLGEEDGN